MNYSAYIKSLNKNSLKSTFSYFTKIDTLKLIKSNKYMFSAKILAGLFGFAYLSNYKFNKFRTNHFIRKKVAI